MKKKEVLLKKKKETKAAREREKKKRIRTFKTRAHPETILGKTIKKTNRRKKEKQIQ